MDPNPMQNHALSALLPEHVTERARDALAEVAEAAASAGRSADDVKIVAVSKHHPPSLVRAAYDAGLRTFGESYVQEAVRKQDEMASEAPSDLQWHFIGRLQSNKAKHVVDRFALIHSVDSSKLAQTLHKVVLNRASASVQDVLLQVDLAGEAQKGGVGEESIVPLAEEIAGLSGLRLQGVMFMPPNVSDPEELRPLFARARRTRDALSERLGEVLPILSMGMSGDFPQAVAEGATHVRIGTRIFGPRPCKVQQSG